MLCYLEKKTKEVPIVVNLSFKFVCLDTDINQESHVEVIFGSLDGILESGLALSCRSGKACYQDHVWANFILDCKILVLTNFYFILFFNGVEV